MSICLCMCGRAWVGLENCLGLRVVNEMVRSAQKERGLVGGVGGGE